MVRVCIYGIGKVFETFFLKTDSLLCFMKTINMDVVAVADGNMANENKKIRLYNGKYLNVKSKISLAKNIDHFDYIVISSNNYYTDIKKELLSLGIPEGRIMSLYDIETMFYKEKFDLSIFQGKDGIEIGGPSKVFNLIYHNCNSCDDVNYSNETVWWSRSTDGYLVNGKALGNVYIADAVDLSIIPSDKYDFVLSSNNIEHIANPLKALFEFKRVVKRGGKLLIVVPNKDMVFDHNRDYTSFEHIVEDYVNDVDESDLTHLSEIIEKHDYDMDVACGGREKYIKRAYRNFENRCMHHHVFSIEVLAKISDYLGLETLNLFSFGTNYFLLASKL